MIEEKCSRIKFSKDGKIEYLKIIQSEWHKHRHVHVHLHVCEERERERLICLRVIEKPEKDKLCMQSSVKYNFKSPVCWLRK